MYIISIWIGGDTCVYSWTKIKIFVNECTLYLSSSMSATQHVLSY